MPDADSFDISVQQPTIEADQKTLTGWFQMGDRFREFRLYSKKSDIGKIGNAACMSGFMLSLAGVPTPDFNGRRMTISGSIHRAGGAEAGSTADDCGSGLVFLAADISIAD